jgi:hypothetical protein
MAYVTQYKVAFTNENLQKIEILIQEDGGSVVDIEEYAAVNVKLRTDGDEGKFTSIYGTSLEMEVDIRDDQPNLDILDTAKDHEWRVVATIEDKPLFTGFILADDGGVPFQDLPYNKKIVATDGIGLLKEKDLVNLDEEEFDSHHSLIEIIAACLKQTGTELPIRVYDNIFHRSFLTRDTNKKWDFVSQTYLEYRTFLKDATEFVSCHEALEIIFKDTFRLFQWHGQWVVARLGQMQYEPFVRYYTLYDVNGENPVGYEDEQTFATVGKHELMYPHGEDQMRYVKKAVKTSELTYNYNVWPEIPKNNKFERGELVSTGTAYDETDIDGDDDFSEVIGTVKRYAIDDWERGSFYLTDSPDFTMSPSAVAQALTHRVYNVYDVEIAREVAIPGSTIGGFNVSGLKSEQIPVIQGARIKFGADKRFDANLSVSNSTNISGLAIVYIIPDGGGTPWYLVNSYTDPSRDGKWIQSTNRQTLNVQFGDSDTRKYASLSVESQPIPCNGNLRIILLNEGRDGHVNYFRNVEFEYFPMVAGGFQRVKGETDYFTQSQQNWPDKSTGEVFLSDNINKVFKGCLLNSSGIPLTADFYRLGINETKRYLQLTNFYKFQLEQRRYWFIEGSFSGLMFNSNHDPDDHYPLGLHKQYLFADLDTPKRFILGGPLEMDLIKGWVTARFYEVFVGTTVFFDGTRTGTQEFKYIF